MSRIKTKFLTDNAVTDAKIRQGAATTIIGRSANSTGNVADIAASADGQVLQRSGGALSFALLVNVNIDSAAAIAFSKLASLTSGNILVGSAGNVATSVAMSSEATIVASGAVTLSNAAVIGKVLTGFTSGAGTVSASDSILSAIQKLDGNTSVKLTSTLTNAHIFVGNGSNVATDVAVSGDLTLVNTGAFTIANLAVTNAKIANSTIDLTTKVTGVLPSANVGLGRTINAQTGTTYTFVLSDGSAAGANTLVTASNASAQTYTVPPNSSVAYPVGTQIDVVQLGAGKVTLAQGSGVTINSKASNKSIGAQYVGVTLIKTATDTWLLLGDLIA